MKQKSFLQNNHKMRFFLIFIGNLVLAERSFSSSHKYEKVISPENYVYHKKSDLKRLALVSPESIRNARILPGKRSEQELSNLWDENLPGFDQTCLL